MATKREKEIEETKKQIALLQKKLEVLESLSELEEEKLLFDFPDFPTGLSIQFAVRFIATPQEKACRYIYNPPTVGDLIRSSEEELLACRGIGKTRLKQITDWMEKHNYKFI